MKIGAVAAAHEHGTGAHGGEAGDAQHTGAQTRRGGGARGARGARGGCRGAGAHRLATAADVAPPRRGATVGVHRGAGATRSGGHAGAAGGQDEAGQRAGGVAAGTAGAGGHAGALGDEVETSTRATGAPGPSLAAGDPGTAGTQGNGPRAAQAGQRATVSVHRGAGATRSGGHAGAAGGQDEAGQRAGGVAAGAAGGGGHAGALGEEVASGRRARQVQAWPPATRAQPVLRGTDRAQPKPVSAPPSAFIAARVRQDPAATPAPPAARTRPVSAPVELRRAQPAAAATPVRWEKRSRPAPGRRVRSPAAVTAAAAVHQRPTPIPTERLALPELATTWDAAEEAVRTFPDLPFGQVGAKLARENLENLRGAEVGLDVVAKAGQIQTREGRQPPYLFEEMLYEFLQWLEAKLKEMFRLVGLHKEAAAREKQDAAARDPRFRTPPASGRALQVHGHADAAIRASRPEPRIPPKNGRPDGRNDTGERSGGSTGR